MSKRCSGQNLASSGLKHTIGRRTPGYVVVADACSSDMFVAISDLTGPSAPSIGREVGPEVDIGVVLIVEEAKNAAQTEP